LYYALLHIQLWRVADTTSIPQINNKHINPLVISIPPFPEQRAIAAALSDMDALLAALDSLITKKRDVKQAAMQQLLTGKLRLPGFSGKWEVKSVFELAERRKELFDDGDWIEAEFLTENGVRLVQTGNIGEGQFIDKEAKKYISADSYKKLGCKEVKPGDILICRLAEPAGRACLFPTIGEERVITAVDVTIFRPLASVADRRYLVNVFSTPAWFDAVNERCGGSTRNRIARGALGRIDLRIPPLPEQTAIATVLTDMDAEVASLQARRDKTQALKQGMMQQLLTGKIRLR
jgi:type I restriction enzyme S subunit